MKLDKIIKGRRSVRLFDDKIVSDDSIENIIKSATWAPSACNKQAWRFIVIRDKRKLKLLSDFGGAYFIKNSSQAILVIYKNTTDNIEYMDYIQSASAAIQNMQLKIFSMGLGSCWVNNLPKKSVIRKMFRIPNTYDPIALVIFGYSKIKQKEIKRSNPVKELISYDNFTFKTDSLNLKSYNYLIRRCFRFIYINLPAFLRKLLQPIVRKFEKKFFV